MWEEEVEGGGTSVTSVGQLGTHHLTSMMAGLRQKVLESLYWRKLDSLYLPLTTDDFFFRPAYRYQKLLSLKFSIFPSSDYPNVTVSSDSFALFSSSWLERSGVVIFTVASIRQQVTTSVIIILTGLVIYDVAGCIRHNNVVFIRCWTLCLLFHNVFWLHSTTNDLWSEILVDGINWVWQRKRIDDKLIIPFSSLSMTTLSPSFLLYPFKVYPSIFLSTVQSLPPPFLLKHKKRNV